MSRFDTLGFSDLGTGDGVSRGFPIAGQDEAVTDFAVESVRRDGWQGQVLMSPNPRTNYATYSNDFTRPEWNGSPSLFLGFQDQRYFVVDSSGALQQKPFSDIITFTRAGGGGRTNAQGQYEWLPANTPRIDYDPVTGECLGLLIEEQRTNLLTYSSDFANAAWPKLDCNVTAGAILSPDGTATAAKMLLSGPMASGLPRALGLTVGATYTWSIYAKRGEYDYLLLRPSAGTYPTNFIQFDLRDGSIVFSNIVNGVIASGAESVGDGWYRCWFSSKAEAVGRFSVYASELPNSEQINTPGGGIYIWGAQLEQGAFPTSYIPTAGAQVTRAADIASVNELSPWYNASEGALFVEASTTSTRLDRWITLSGVGTNRLFVSRLLNGKMEAYVTKPDATPVGVIGDSTIQSGETAKVAVSVGSGTISLSVNDQAVKSTMAAMPDVNVMTIGGEPGATRNLNGHIRSVRFYPRRLSNTELQAITA